MATKIGQNASFLVAVGDPELFSPDRHGSFVDDQESEKEGAKANGECFMRFS